MSEQIMRENLFVIAQAYATAKGLAMTTVSKQIHGNQVFLEQFVRGEISVTIRKYYQMLDFLRDNWPTNVEWPQTQQIYRPARVPYSPPATAPTPRTLPTRGERGKFLGKKVHNRRVRA